MNSVFTLRNRTYLLFVFGKPEGVAYSIPARALPEVETKSPHGRHLKMADPTGLPHLTELVNGRRETGLPPEWDSGYSQAPYMGMWFFSLTNQDFWSRNISLRRHSISNTKLIGAWEGHLSGHLSCAFGSRSGLVGKQL